MKPSQLTWRRDLLLLVPGVLILLLSAFATAASAGCEEFKTCESCKNETSLNCSWVSCSNDSVDARCINETQNTRNCSATPCGAISPTSTAVTATSPAASTSTTPSSSTTIAPTPPSKKGTFDAASFIGGIVLVLGIQAVIFFLYKFCKAKDRNYHTL
uniref:CD164 molecule n=1 Tax=Xenopus tropicalis TaxID=8364 RepID=A0A803JAV1_XENTR